MYPLLGYPNLGYRLDAAVGEGSHRRPDESRQRHLCRSCAKSIGSSSLWFSSGAPASALREGLVGRGGTKRLIGELAEDQYRAVEIERFGTEAVCRVVSDLYSDPSNTFIPWSDMVRVALMRLAGVPEYEVAAELSILRRVVAR